MYLVRFLFILFIFFYFLGCGDDLSISDGMVLSGDRGVVLMSFTYREGFPTYESMTFTIESLDRTFFTKVRIDKNTKRLITMDLREGKYFFSDVYAVADTSYATPDRKEDMPMFYGYVPENVFEVKARVVNYVGDIVVQTKRERVGRKFGLFSDSGLREDSYFFSSLVSGTGKVFRKRYPSLSSRYTLLGSGILYGIESVNEKESYYKEKASTFYGYGGQAYGKDLRGYGDYEWGMGIEELELLLSKGGREHKFIDSFTVEVKVLGKRAICYFSSIDKLGWGKSLYKVLVHSSYGIDGEIDRITQSHGFPTRKGSKFVWELPSTLITLSKGEKGVLISYESREYIRDVLRFE